MRFAPISIFAVALSLAAAASASTPLRGDAEAGQSLFSLECGACHGSDCKGHPSWKAAHPESRLPDLVHSAFLVTRTDEQLHQAMATGHTVDQRWIPGHVFSNLSALDRWNVIQWLRDQSLRVEDFFPQAVKFTAKAFRIDEYGAKRLAAVGADPSELEVVVLTAYRGTRKPNEPLRLVPWTPVELDLLDAKERLGHLCFFDVRAPGSGELLHVGVAFDPAGQILSMRVRHPDATKRAAYEKALGAFVGRNVKTAQKLDAPRGLAQGAAWAQALSKPISLAAEGIVMFDKDERARRAFDL